MADWVRCTIADGYGPGGAVVPAPAASTGALAGGGASPPPEFSAAAAEETELELEADDALPPAAESFACGRSPITAFCDEN